jgi:glycosyltransferase involved in cell wall biosynthesis
MHIVMLTNAVAPDKLGGLERYVRELSAELVRRDCQVSVVAKRTDAAQSPDEVATDGIRIVRYCAPSKNDLTFAVRYPWTVARAVDRAVGQARRPGNHDVVLHAHFPVPALGPALRRLPYVYTVHAPVYRELLGEHQGSYVLPQRVRRAAVAGLRTAESLVIRRAGHIITLSEYMRREVELLDPTCGPRSTIIAGGIDAREFAPGPGRAELWPGAGPLLFTARRLVPRTGVLQLVQAMPAILRARPTARLAIAGSGLQQGEIAAAIAHLGLQDSVRLLGQVNQPELTSWYRTADLAITPSQEMEGFGLATAEAMACGTPCLVTPAGANPELVAGVSTLLVTDGWDPDSIAEGVRRVLDSALLPHLGGRVRSVIAAGMDWPHVAARHVELYTRAAGSGHRISGAGLGQVA